MARRSTPRERRKVLDALAVPEVYRGTEAVGGASEGREEGVKADAVVPVRYSPELAMRICDDLAAGMTLKQVCRQEGMPTETAVRKWALDMSHPFGALYVRAREIGFVKMADDLVDIVDDGSNDWIERERRDGSIETVLDREHVARSELRFRARQWLLAKALPKIYGDKLDINHSGRVDVRKLTEAELDERLADVCEETGIGRVPGVEEGLAVPPRPAGVVH